MKSEELLKDLLLKVDTACWCWNVKNSTKKSIKVDWKSAFDELNESYWKYKDAKENESIIVVLGECSK